MVGKAALAVFLFAGSVRAEETIAFTPYAAWRRPLTPISFPGPPSIRRNIVGAAVEWLDAPQPERTGWTLRFGAAVEHQADCPTSASCPWPGGGGSRLVDRTEFTSLLPENHVEWGANARGGWSWRAFQFEGGLLVYTASVANRSREINVLPDAVVRVGSRSAFAALGFGSFTGASLLSPSLYLQGELAFADRWATTFTFAGHNQPFAAQDVSPYQHLRWDLALRYRVVPAVRAGLGLALTTTDPDRPTKLGGDVRFIVEWTRRE